MRRRKDWQGVFSAVQWVEKYMGKIRGVLVMGEKETPECGVGKAGSGAVISLGKDMVQFPNQHRNTFKIRKKNRSG